MKQSIEQQMKIKGIFDKCFVWATKEFQHLDTVFFPVISSEISDLANTADIDDKDIIETAKQNVEYALKQPFTKYVCEVGETEMSWEWITDKKKKRTATGSKGYLKAALYDKFERTVGRTYPINSIDKVEDWYYPNITLDIYSEMKKEYKDDIKGISKKILISAIKTAIDLNIKDADTVEKLIRFVISDVFKFVIEFEETGREDMRLEITKEIQSYFGDCIYSDGYNDTSKVWLFELDLDEEYTEDIEKFCEDWNNKKPYHISCNVIETAFTGTTIEFQNNFIY